MSETPPAKRVQAFIIGANYEGITHWLTPEGQFTPNRSEAQIHDCIAAQAVTETVDVSQIVVEKVDR